MPHLKPNYFHHHIDAKFVTHTMFYVMYMPMQMSNYNKLKQLFVRKKMPINREIGMIEKASFFGFGRIGLEHSSGTKQITGDFIGFEIVGDYKQMKDAYCKIKKDYPKACNFYNLYLTDPSVTPMEENKTRILFQI